MRADTGNERLLCDILNEAYPGQWVREYLGIEGRKFKFDVANPGKLVAIEIEGGIYTYGRHNRPLGYINDKEPYRDWETDRKSTRLNSSH